MITGENRRRARGAGGAVFDDPHRQRPVASVLDDTPAHGCSVGVRAPGCSASGHTAGWDRAGNSHRRWTPGRDLPALLGAVRSGATRRALNMGKERPLRGPVQGRSALNWFLSTAGKGAVMNTEIFSDTRRIRSSRVLDGSRAMELLTVLSRFEGGEIILDFSGVRRFEPFGVDVLLRGLSRRQAGGPRIRCSGLPARLARRFREENSVIA
jgi:anti-anti-sigma regulatory factor